MDQNITSLWRLQSFFEGKSESENDRERGTPLKGWELENWKTARVALFFFEKSTCRENPEFYSVSTCLKLRRQMGRVYFLRLGNGEFDLNVFQGLKAFLFSLIFLGTFLDSGSQQIT